MFKSTLVLVALASLTSGCAAAFAGSGAAATNLKNIQTVVGTVCHDVQHGVDAVKKGSLDQLLGTFNVVCDTVQGPVTGTVNP